MSQAAGKAKHNALHSCVRHESVSTLRPTSTSAVQTAGVCRVDHPHDAGTDDDVLGTTSTTIGSLRRPQASQIPILSPFLVVCTSASSGTPFTFHLAPQPLLQASSFVIILMCVANNFLLSCHTATLFQPQRLRKHVV